MAERLLDAQAQLAKRPVELRHKEQRIIAEAAGPARFLRDHSITAALGDGDDLTLRIGHRRDAEVERLPAIVRERSQFRQQLAIVGRVVAMRAGVPSREDTWPALQRWHY